MTLNTVFWDVMLWQKFANVLEGPNMTAFIVDEGGMEAEGSSNTSLNFCQTAQCHMPVVAVYSRCLYGNSVTSNFLSLC